ncbi:hypothetical protein DPMN_064768 [Dreissena polymorpha]|uniref:Uncharacterized protein n=1 Tax=Dreissena polymorpha TaxID=45954 RepID=A0A9D4HJR3_DREPO|nr:hypothetical protein DPMN_064768 [Dreissena polymorpha]
MIAKTEPERLITGVKTVTDCLQTEVKPERFKIADTPTTERNKTGNKTKIEQRKSEGKSVIESKKKLEKRMNNIKLEN